MSPRIRQRLRCQAASGTRTNTATGQSLSLRYDAAALGNHEFNYGLDTLRFVKPVGIGDTIRARLTAKRKIDRNRKDHRGVGQGVVAWDVEVINQDGELVASYDILTLVMKQG